MTILTNSIPIGNGTNRSCYINPIDDTKCIKINTSEDLSETKKEIAYYNYLINKNISFKHLSRYYGKIHTDIGIGYTFDLIKDYDGKISKTLSYYLQTEEKTKSIANPLKLLEELKNYTLEEEIIVKDLNTKNMLYQKIDEDNGKLIIIDGIANSRFLYPSRYFKNFRLQKIQSLWKDFEQSLPIKYSFNQYFINLCK
jgi:hypothetical protein